jgi:hypothetical protein
MGSYNTAVITTVGQALLTSVLGSQGTMTFTKLQTSSYAYASGTDLSALTSLNNVEQEASIGTATIVDSTHIAADATISNSGISTEYNANTLGIFASDGDNEVLFAVSTAVTPDVIPVDQGGTPSTYKYNFTLAVSSTSDITISAVGNIDASDVAYDNSVSGLSATNVQAALDELASVKTAGVITPSAASVVLNNVNPTATVSFTTNSDGVASVASSDPTVATASLSGTVVTINRIKGGNVTVTISIPETALCTACSATISVESIPTGSTVTPTNSIETWLHCAGIFDKPYTTLTEVLADSTTLATLISSQNAVNYMVRSTSWATNICANSTAMSLIGLNNYCANKLLANSTWLNAIANSTYIESVMNVKVPTMTSNTTPSGVVTGYGTVNGQSLVSNFYQIFIQTSSEKTRLWDEKRIGNAYVQYEFPQKVRIKLVEFRYYGVTLTGTTTISALDDNNNSITIGEHNFTSSDNDTTIKMVLNNNIEYSKYRLTTSPTFYNTSDGYYTTYMRWLQFYGREDV